MNRKQSVIIMVCVLAGIVNTYGAVRKGKSIETALAGTLVVTVILLAVAESDRAATVAEMFAIAFFITSMADNGTDLLILIGNLQAPVSHAEGTIKATQTPRTNAGVSGKPMTID